MPNLVALGIMNSDEISKISFFFFFLSFVAMATTVFEGIKFFQIILKDRGRSISANSHQNWISSFREEDI